MPRDVFLARFVRGNRGDFANQAGVLAGLLRSPHVKNVYLSTYYPHHVKDEPRIIPVAPSKLRGYLTTGEESRVLKDGTPVFWGGGVDLQDTGSKAKMVLLMLRVKLLKRFRSPFVIAFQGAGPVRSTLGRFFLRQICKCIDFALVREPTAYNLLCEAGGLSKDEVSLAVDGALLLDSPSPDFGKTYIAESGLDPEKPIVGVNLRRWFHQKGGILPTEFTARNEKGTLNESMEKLLDNVANALIESNVSDQVLFMPMYRRYPEDWEDDVLLLEKLQERLPKHWKCVMVEEDLSPRQILSVFSQIQLMIGVRLHSTILAHVAGVPAVHIYYEHKGKEHFEQMGMDNLMVSIQEACEPNGKQKIIACMNRATADSKSLSDQIVSKVSHFRDNAQSVLDRCLASLAEKQTTV